MKLLHMHVDNFGRLQDYDRDFDDGLNIILEENGWGKTTMAAFLKAMLYGFDNGFSRDITENERKRYTPWQGGVYGGTLDFESEGVRYRVKRTFGEGPRFDSVKITNLDTDQPVRIASGSLGEELFKLDAGAFQRIAYINQSASDNGGSESIQNRLNSLIARANNTAAYEGAIADLSQLARVYEKNDGRGQLDSISRSIAEKQAQSDLLEREIREQDAARVRVRDIAAELESVRKTIEQNKVDYDHAVDDRRKLEASRKLLADVNGEINVLKDKQDMIRVELGGSVPEDAAIEENRQNMRAANELAGKIQNLRAVKAADTAAYQEVYDRYQGEIPDAGVLDEIRGTSGELQGVIRAYEEENTAAEEEIEPTGYVTVKEAAANDSDYPEQLSDIIQAEPAVQELIRMRDNNHQTLAHEEELWKSAQTRYTSLTNEIQEREAELERLNDYNPEIVEPSIKELRELSVKRSELEYEKRMLEAMLKKETDEWEALKAKYSTLSEETAAQQKLLDDKADCHPDQLQPHLEKLAELQKMEQAISIRQEALDRNRITEEEKGILEANKDPLPEQGESDQMKVAYRRIMKKQAEKDSIAKKIEGENAKTETLRTELKQVQEAEEENLEPVAEPAKGSGMILIALGALALIAGIALAVMMNPALGAIAAIGLVLIILGFMQQGKYRTAQTAYEAYVAEKERRATEKAEKIAEIQGKIDGVQETIRSLNKDLDDCSARMKDDQQNVVQWVHKYGKAEKLVTEEVLSRIGINADRLRVLRAKAKEQKDTKDFIRKQRDYINTILAQIAAIYPDIAGQSTDETIESLRKKEVDYRLEEGKLTACEEAETKFLDENSCTKEQLTDDSLLVPGEAQHKLEALEGEFNRVDEARWAIDGKYEGLGGLSFDDAIAHLRKKAEEYKIADGQLQAARQNEVHFLMETGVTREAIVLPDSDKTAALKKAKQEIDAKFDETLHRIQSVLGQIQIAVTGENLIESIRTAGQYLYEFNHYSRSLEERAQRQTRRKDQITELETGLSGMLENLKGVYAEEPLSERLDHIRTDINYADNLRTKINETNENLYLTETAHKKLVNEVNLFHNTFGGFVEEGDDVFAAICRKKEEYKDTLNEMAPLLRQKEAIIEEQEGMPDDGGDRENSLRRNIMMLEARRDALVSENSRKKELIRQTDRSVELLPDVKREIGLLYEQRESAKNELDMLKRAMRKISEARENLAGRYLGKVEQLFNDYMQIWLGNDAVRGILDIDFNVSIEESEKIHAAEGYSTGYCDLMDFCMRLALIDTLFENEQPFMILDDPFVNLDEEHLDKALELLSAMSASKQIIYFVCHPVRAVSAGAGIADKEQFRSIARKAEEALNARMEAMPARQKEDTVPLKERYHVNEGAVLPFVITSPVNEIDRNVFTMNFTMAGGSVHPDRMYELFFIDENGHVINNRKLLEIRNERLLPNQLIFSLNPREDSGTQYELMIRDSNSGDFDVDARIPYTAELSAS